MKDDSLRAEVDFAVQVGPGSPLSQAEWDNAYSLLKHYAGLMGDIVNDLARRISADAGLDPGLLGIHPHNAMVAYHAGQPWDGVDYNRVQAVQDLLRHEYDANRMVNAFDRAVRSDPHQRWLAKNTESVTPEPT